MNLVQQLLELRQLSPAGEGALCRSHEHCALELVLEIKLTTGHTLQKKRRTSAATRLSNKFRREGQSKKHKHTHTLNNASADTLRTLSRTCLLTSRAPSRRFRRQSKDRFVTSNKMQSPRRAAQNAQKRARDIKRVASCHIHHLGIHSSA